MATQGSGVSDATVFVSLALFIVWMQRQKITALSGSPSRWGAFFGAISGKYTIPNNVGSSSTSTTTTVPNPTANSGSSDAAGQPLPGTDPNGTGTNKITVVNP